MIWGIETAWLYAYSSNGGQQQDTLYTVFVTGPRQPPMNGQSVLAQISLSYLTTLSELGGGALVHSYTPPFGPDVEFHDHKYNSVWAPNALSVTFALSARGAEAYALATVFVFE